MDLFGENLRPLREIFREEAIRDLESFNGQGFNLTDRGNAWVAGYIAAKFNSFDKNDLIEAYSLGFDRGSNFQKLIHCGILDENFDEVSEELLVNLLETLRARKFEESTKI